MSLAVPGAGQLLAGSYWCLAWFSLAAVIIGAPAYLTTSSPLLAGAARMLPWLATAIFSAEHAKRLFESSRKLTGNCTAQPMVVYSESRKRRSAPKVRLTVQNNLALRAHKACRVSRRGSIIKIRFELSVPGSRDDVWSKISNVSNFACIDPFHCRLIVMGPELKPGVDLALEHVAFGFRFFRFGRLLRFHERRGYTFSDISRRGCRVGFPHVFIVDVEPSDGGRTVLSVQVRGRWTARWIPVPVGMLWLKFVCREHERLLRAAL